MYVCGTVEVGTAIVEGCATVVGAGIRDGAGGAAVLGAFAPLALYVSQLDTWDMMLSCDGMRL